MKNFLLVAVVLALSGCFAVGEFENRDKLYGYEGISNICEQEPDLCDNPENTGW